MRWWMPAIGWFGWLGCDGGKEAVPQPNPACEGWSDAAEVGGGAGIEVDLHRAGCGGIALRKVQLTGDGSFTLDLRADGPRIVPVLTATSPGAVFRGLDLVGTVDLVGQEPLRWWRQGYHSWSASGVFDPVAPALDADGVPSLGGDAGGLDVVLEQPGTSWWAGLVGRGDGGSVLIGAVTATRTKVAVALDPGRDDVSAEVHVIWGRRGEAIAVAEGEVLELDPVLTVVGADPNALWRRWADEVAGAAEIVLPPPPPVGWSTWYQFYDQVSEADVRANLAAAVASNEAGNAPIGLFQLDDGWEVAWGDWTANERFPSGMAALAADIRAAGMVPGLWMAPLYVSRETDTWQAHPDWFVHGPDGAELEYQGNVALDVTHPEAAAWLHDVVAARVAEGWTYLKLDFLYAGAEEGDRYAQVTGVEAYRIATELLRDAAGPDTFILACGAPLLPSVGFADSYRTGPDIAFTLSPDPLRPFLRNQVRSTAARGFTNGRLWWVDPDALLVREPFGPDDARGSVVAQAVSGGAWLLGDDLGSLSAERLGWALSPEATAAVGLDGVPEDPLASASGWDTSPLLELAQPNDQVPTRWTLPNGWTALLNLGDVPLELSGPGGTELLTGEVAEAGPRTLAPGVGELWAPPQ